MLPLWSLIFDEFDASCRKRSGSHLNGVNNDLRAVIGFNLYHVAMRSQELGSQSAADVGQSDEIDLAS